MRQERSRIKGKPPKGKHFQIRQQVPAVTKNGTLTRASRTERSLKISSIASDRAIPYLAKNGAKLDVNAGASDTEILAKYVKKICEDAVHPMRVAWVEGDDVT